MTNFVCYESEQGSLTLPLRGPEAATVGSLVGSALTSLSAISLLEMKVHGRAGTRDILVFGVISPPSQGSGTGPGQRCLIDVQECLPS